MRFMMMIAAGLLLAACNMQSPRPVMSQQESEDYLYCREFIPWGDVVSSGYSDPMAACMQWRKTGWGGRK